MNQKEKIKNQINEAYAVHFNLKSQLEGHDIDEMLYKIESNKFGLELAYDIPDSELKTMNDFVHALRRVGLHYDANVKERTYWLGPVSQVFDFKIDETQVSVRLSMQVK